MVAEAGGVVAADTIRSPEPIFGLAVQGIVEPGRQFTKGGARPGDALVLSKPLGTGLALASGDPDIVPAGGDRTDARSTGRVGALPDRGSVRVTDVTGFGLLGHGWEMADRSAPPVFDEHRRCRCPTARCRRPSPPDCSTRGRRSRPAPTSKAE